MHEYSDAQKVRKRERKTKQHKATQQNTRPETTFSKEKAALRWDSNPHLMYTCAMHALAVLDKGYCHISVMKIKTCTGYKKLHLV